MRRGAGRWAELIYDWLLQQTVEKYCTGRDRCNTAQLLHGCTAADLSPAHHRRRSAYAATLPRQVYETSFWRPREAYKSSHNQSVNQSVFTPFPIGVAEYCDKPVCLCVCVFVCLSASIFQEIRVRSKSPISGESLPSAVARLSSGGVAICYVFPV